MKKMMTTLIFFSFFIIIPNKTEASLESKDLTSFLDQYNLLRQDDGDHFTPTFPLFVTEPSSTRKEDFVHYVSSKIVWPTSKRKNFLMLSWPTDHTKTHSGTLIVNSAETMPIGAIHTTHFTFYDKLRNRHDIICRWTREGTLDQMLWNLDVTAEDDSVFITKNDASGTAYSGLKVLFNPDGTVNNWDSTAITGLNPGDPPPNMFITCQGAAETTTNEIVPNLGTSGALGTATLGSIQHSSEYSNNFFVKQNGVPYVNYNRLSIDKNGILTAQFDNGEAIPIGQFTLAEIPDSK